MVIPCYNKAPYIGEMLDSVIAQVWDNIELILVNDGSTDGTREIISVYEPKLRARGYELVIIDQENQGVAAAVRNGMLRMTGEYFCTADCDDMLDPEYVSAMAGWLSSHGACDRVVCDTYTGAWDRVSMPGLRRKYSDFAGVTVHDTYLTEKFLLYRQLVSSCVLMTRVKYLNKCKVTENFAVSPRATQEMQIGIPLAAGGGSVVHMHKALYSARAESRKQSLHKTWADMIRFRKEVLELKNKSISRLELGEYEKKRLYVIAELGEKIIPARCLYDYDDAKGCEEEYADYFSEVANKYFVKSPKITRDKVLNAGLANIIRAIENKIVGYENEYVHLTDEEFRRPGGRIIAYGAFGLTAKQLLPALLNTPLKPDLLWDMAYDGSQNPICGLPVTRPDFAVLDAKDIVLVLIKKEFYAKDVYISLEHSNVGLCFYYYDVADYLAAYYFSEIETCEFTV